MKYRDEKFYWTYQRGIGWSDDYIGPDSMTRWIIETSVGFTDVGLLRISKSVRAYPYLILSSQASARSSIVENTASSLTAQLAFLNNFENVVNRGVNIQEDIKRYQDTLSYALVRIERFNKTFTLTVCVYCNKPLTCEDRVEDGFGISKLNEKTGYPMEDHEVKFIYEAHKLTGLSVSSLINAVDKRNAIITRRNDKQRFIFIGKAFTKFLPN